MTAATKASLSSLAHRIQALDDELAELDERIEALLVATAPELLGSSVLVPTPRPHSWWPPATTPNAFTQRPPGPICAVWPRSPPARASPAGTAPHSGGDRQANSALWRIVHGAHRP